MPTTGQTSLTIRGLAGLLGLFAGLCALFALIVTLIEGWRENAQLRWPQTTATIERCTVDPYIPFHNSKRTPVWQIHCRIDYEVGGRRIQTSLRSRTTSSSSGEHLERVQVWVAEHASGGLISIHYDPEDATKAVLTTTDMPDAGPQTPNKLKLLLIFSVASAALLTIARWMR